MELRTAKSMMTLAAAAFVLAIGAVPVKAANPIVLKGITPWQASYAHSASFFMFQKMVNQKLKGKVIVSYLGASEVVPAFEQFEAVRDGVVDVIMGVGSYYKGQLPEGAATLGTSKSPAELRKNGYFDLMRKVHAEKGVHFLAMSGGTRGDAYRCYTKKKIAGPDFSGLKLRVSGTYIPLVKALGGQPVRMKPGEVYTALERGVVDGFCWTYLGIRDWAFQEVAKYVIDHPFYSVDGAILFNLKTWNKLPADVRDALEAIAKDLEPAVEKHIAKLNSREDKALKKAGMEFIHFDAAGARKFHEAAYASHWKWITDKSPKYGAKLKALGE